jgi:hypothetical protein
MSNPSVNKRQKERARAEKQRDKAMKKKERKDEKDRTPGAQGPQGVDPDIAHITPGPQPPPDWALE